MPHPVMLRPQPFSGPCNGNARPLLLQVISSRPYRHSWEGSQFGDFERTSVLLTMFAPLPLCKATCRCVHTPLPSLEWSRGQFQILKPNPAGEQSRAREANAHSHKAVRPSTLDPWGWKVGKIHLKRQTVSVQACIPSLEPVLLLSVRKMFESLPGSS